MPGHTNAALASYPELNCNGRLRSRTPAWPSASARCVSEHDVTYQFIDDVVREIAAMTPGPYFHIGGDEVKTLTPRNTSTSSNGCRTIVQSHGKQLIGWDEIAHATLSAEYRRAGPASPRCGPSRRRRRPNSLLSPANKVYLDMKRHHASVPLGLNWGGKCGRGKVPVRMESLRRTCRPCRKSADSGVETPIV